MTTSLLGPEVHHCAGEIKGISCEGSDGKADRHHASLNVVVAEIIIDPQEEEFVLAPGISSAETSPKNVGT
jgi:hypothetical protein